MRDAEDYPAYVVGACVDITERKRAEAEREMLLSSLRHHAGQLQALA